jgi:uncharacterized RDD family membrane protein YckC
LVKEPKEYALEYAGFWIRLGAGIIDLLILGPIVGLLICIFPSSFIWITVSWLISLAYYVGFVVWRGQTPGKIIVGIKVICTDKTPPTFRDSILRYCGYLASILSFFAGFIVIAFDEKKQGFHDKIADTYVVKLPVRQVVLSAKPYTGRGASVA